ncbi:MAG: hypothetical protein QM758_19530 [Armatimonas sp.]
MIQLNVSDAGYFVALSPVGTEEAKQGSVRSAYLAIPTGQKGLSVVVGQTSPLMFQYDPVNALTRVLPQSLTGPIHGFLQQISSPRFVLTTSASAATPPQMVTISR